MEAGGVQRETSRVVQSMKNFYASELSHFPKRMTDSVESPCFVVNKDLLRKNLEILDKVRKRTGAKVLLALKAFAMHSAFPMMRPYLDGIAASGPIEARLGAEEFGKEVHTFAVAFSENDMKETIKYSSTIIFNSVAQWKKYRPMIKKSAKKIEIGLRVNPGRASMGTDMYNPTLPGSRLGVNPKDLKDVDLSGIDGLHFHALCEQNADSLVKVLKSFESRYSKIIPKMKWVNWGGGHHITRNDYDLELLIRTINDFKERYGVQVHLEPGEAIALNAGILVSTVMDTTYNGMDIAILDTSAEAHMPDVLAQPYRPNIIGAGMPGEQRYTYRLGGMTCLAGDVIGDYSFPRRLKTGDRLVFLDMAHYSMVKTTTFNGIRHPSLALYSKKSRNARVVRRFGYGDYKNRLS